MKKRQINGRLTGAERKAIRKLLPRDWRKRIAGIESGITVRQVTEVFDQRTTNPSRNEIVWSAINSLLRAAGKDELAGRVEERKKFCLSLYDVLQN